MSLTSRDYNISNPALRKCHVELVLLPDAPQGSYLADSLHHVFSRKRIFPMMNDTDSHAFRMSMINCQACVSCPCFLSKLTIKHGDLILNQDMDGSEIYPEPFVAWVQITPSLGKIFESLAPPSAEINMYSHSEIHKSVLD